MAPENQQFIPKKPTDEESKAEIRRIYASAATNDPTIDDAQIDAAAEELFRLLKKNFGNGA